jgi:hypothetical protein
MWLSISDYGAFLLWQISGHEVSILERKGSYHAFRFMFCIDARDVALKFIYLFIYYLLFFLFIFLFYNYLICCGTYT